MRPETTLALSEWLAAQRERLHLPLLTTGITGCPDPEDIVSSPTIPETAKPHLLVLLEWQSLLLVIYLVLAGSKPSNSTRWRENVVQSLVYRIVTGLKASFDLASSGLELQHFQIARIIAEDTQCLSLALLSDEFCDEFRNGNSPETANTVWHTTMSRGRLRKRLVEALTPLVPDGEVAGKSDYRKREEVVFGCFVHPSYISGLMHKFIEGEDRMGGLPWFRDEPATIGTRPYTFLNEGLIELTYAIEFRREFLRTLRRRKIMGSALGETRFYLTNAVPYAYGLIAAGYFAGYIADSLLPTETDA